LSVCGKNCRCRDVARPLPGAFLNVAVRHGVTTLKIATVVTDIGGDTILVSGTIQNRLPGTIERMASGKIVSELVIRTVAGELTSIISTRSIERLNLEEGDRVFALFKATEVSVEKE